MTWQIFAAEINFEDAALHVREKFNGSESNVKSFLIDLRSRFDEVFILATRHRFTVYIVHENLNSLTDFFNSEHNLKGYVQYYYNSAESVTHLMATASGLLSPVKGEGGILADLIRCFQWASSCGCLGITLDNTLTKAIETGREVRMATGIDQFCSSVVETGLELLYSRMEDLHKKNFLIIGTGKLARLAIEYLTKEGMKNVAITGHDHKMVLEFARKFSIKVFPIGQLPEYFFMADVIIGASHHELKIDFVPDNKTQKENKNCIVLDLGVPPNFDQQWVERHTAEFYNIDDLRRLQPSPLESFGGLELAWRMVMKTSGDFVHLLQMLQRSPVLTAYLSRQFNLKNGEWKVKPKKSLRNILLFKKSEHATGVSPANDVINAKVHANNHKAENGQEIVRNLSGMKKFVYILSPN